MDRAMRSPPGNRRGHCFIVDDGDLASLIGWRRSEVTLLPVAARYPKSSASPQAKNPTLFSTRHWLREYCVAFGGVAGGQIASRGATSFKVTKPTAQACSPGD